jgi:predicted transcriptional regulator
MVQDLVERLFDGSAMKLVMRALSSKKASQKELAEIRKVLDEYERGRKQKWID